MKKLLLLFIVFFAFGANVVTMSYFDEPSFSDISSANKNYKAVEYLKYHNIIDGYDDGTFKPNKKINRAEFLKLILEMKIGYVQDYEESCFDDVLAGVWYSKYVCYAKKLGIVKGYFDGTFKPAQQVNKVEALKILAEVENVRFTDYDGFGDSKGKKYKDMSWDLDDTKNTNLPYSDIENGTWYSPYIKFAYNRGFLDEEDNFFPSRSITRGYTAELIYRSLLTQEYRYGKVTDEYHDDLVKIIGIEQVMFKKEDSEEKLFEVPKNEGIQFAFIDDVGYFPATQVIFFNNYTKHIDLVIISEDREKFYDEELLNYYNNNVEYEFSNENVVTHKGKKWTPVKSGETIVTAKVDNMKAYVGFKFVPPEESELVKLYVFLKPTEEDYSKAQAKVISEKVNTSIIQVDGIYANGAEVELTEGVKFESTAPRIFKVNDNNEIVPYSNGIGALRISVGDLFALFNISVSIPLTSPAIIRNKTGGTIVSKDGLAKLIIGPNRLSSEEQEFQINKTENGYEFLPKDYKFNTLVEMQIPLQEGSGYTPEQNFILESDVSEALIYASVNKDGTYIQVNADHLVDLGLSEQKKET